MKNFLLNTSDFGLENVITGLAVSVLDIIESRDPAASDTKLLDPAAGVIFHHFDRKAPHPNDVLRDMANFVRDVAQMIVDDAEYHYLLPGGGRDFVAKMLASTEPGEWPTTRH